jgi:hypothetical protein
MTEASLVDMKTGFPQAPEPIQGIPTLQSLIELLFHLCCCMQAQRSPVPATMNLLFCTAPPYVYAFLTAESSPAIFVPFLPIVPDVPNYTACTNDNKHATVKAMHAIDNKMQVDIVTMNTALANVFLEALSSQVCASFLLQRCLCKPNIIFVDLFVWFVNHYGRTMAEDCKANHQRMAANWHHANGFNTLVLCLFTGVVFTGCTNFTMANRDIFDIGLCVIKWCGMYARSTRHGSHTWPSVQESSKLLTPSKHSGRQRSLWSTRLLSPPVNTGTEWPPPTTMTQSFHMGNLLQILVPRMPPPKNQSGCRE